MERISFGGGDGGAVSAEPAWGRLLGGGRARGAGSATSLPPSTAPAGGFNRRLFSSRLSLRRWRNNASADGGPAIIRRPSAQTGSLPSAPKTEPVPLNSGSKPSCRAWSARGQGQARRDARALCIPRAYPLVAARGVAVRPLPRPGSSRAEPSGTSGTGKPSSAAFRCPCSPGDNWPAVSTCQCSPANP